ncbi:hypothetical protein Sjap_001252 [Stephania japonica]|uniref:Uncharacterized protein n=1 Tax=Stephania japonica TaxID=461633 RepID=A0AAP0PRH6_9MAGN
MTLSSLCNCIDSRPQIGVSISNNIETRSEFSLKIVELPLYKMNTCPRTYILRSSSSRWGRLPPSSKVIAC